MEYILFIIERKDYDLFIGAQNHTRTMQNYRVVI